LGPDSYGLYTAVLTYVGVFALVFNLGFEDLLNAKIPQNLEDKERISFIFSSFSLLRVAILLFGGITLYFLSEPIASIIGDPAAAHYLRISIPFFFFANLKTLFLYFFTGLFRFGTLAVGKAFASIAQVLGVIIVFNAGWGIEGLIYLLAIINVVLIALYFVFSYRHLSLKPFRKPDWGLFRSSLLFGLAVWVINLANFGLGKQSDIILMGIFDRPNSDIGFYQTAFGFCNTLNTLALGGFFGLSLTTLAAAFMKGKRVLGKAWAIFIKVISFTVSPGLLFTIILAKPIIIGLFGEEYAPAIVPYQVFASIMLAARYLGGKSHLVALYAAGREKIGFVTRLVIGSVNIGLNLILIPKWGALGALIGTGTSEVFMSLAEMIAVSRITGTRFPIKFQSILLVCSLLASIPLFFIKIESLLLTAILGILYYLLTIALLWLFKPLSQEDIETVSSVNSSLAKAAALFAKKG
jgi:O-antigen/teichoic acid export membrane protein